MIVRIDYRAAYLYDEAVSLSPHVVRLFPRDPLAARIRTLDFRSNPSADCQYRRDLFDNLVARCFYPQEEDTLWFELRMELALEERNPFHFLLESRALCLPVAYDEQEQTLLRPCLAAAPLRDIPADLATIDASSTVEAITAINRWMFENIRYQRREDGPARPPQETLNARTGACRDTSLLLAAYLRGLGLAVRLASGYLWEGDAPAADRRAGSALHAWAEVYLPGAGWVGLDPTNGVLCDHHFITTAVGVTPADITPVDGRYYGDRAVGSRLEAALRIARL